MSSITSDSLGPDTLEGFKKKPQSMRNECHVKNTHTDEAFYAIVSKKLHPNP